MNTANHTRENFTGESRLKPRKEELIAIPPNRKLWIDDSGTASFIIGELRRNTRAYNEIDEVMSVDIRLYLLTPDVKIVFTKLLGDLESKLQRRTRLSRRR
jgi:hypothetical protein